MKPGQFKAILGQKCPVCYQGRVFSGLWRKHKNCPECGLQYERELGYFHGFMYKTYAAQAIALLPTALSLWLLTVDIIWIYRVLVIQFLCQYLWLNRVSTCAFMHFDEWLDPRTKLKS